MEKHLSNAFDRLLGNYELHIKQNAYQYLKLWIEKIPELQKKIQVLEEEKVFLQKQIADLKSELTALQFVPEKTSKGKKDAAGS